MGSMRSIVSMIPGISGKVTDENLEQGDRQLKIIEAMIHSMTKRERENPSIINPSRKRRIAAGSGTRVEDVNRLLKQFDQMKQMMKKMGGLNKKGFKRRMKFPPNEQCDLTAQTKVTPSLSNQNIPNDFRRKLPWQLNQTSQNGR